MFVTYFTCYIRTKRFDPDKAIARVFDSVTFSSSALLLLGIFEPAVLSLIGSTKMFLLVAGMGGLLYGIHSMFR